MKGSASLLQKTVEGDSFSTTEDAVPHWPMLDVCRPRRARNLNNRRLLCSRFAGGRFAGPASGRKGWSPVLCCSVGGEATLTRQAMFSFYRCHHVVVRSLTSIQEARGKRFHSFTGQPQRHSTRQRRQSKHSFVTEYMETTASVSYHNRGSL